MPYTELYVGSALFADSFAEGLGKWTIFAGSWSTSLSGYAEFSGVGGILGEGSQTFSDFILNVRAKFTGTPSSSQDYFAIDFRQASPGQTFTQSTYHLRYRYDGVIELWVSPANTLLGSHATGASSTRWVHIKLIASGSNLKVYVNNVLQINVTDATYSSGYFGFSTSLIVAGVKIRYADVLLQGTTKEFTNYLTTCDDSLGATALSTFKARLAGRPRDLQNSTTGFWPLYATGNNIVGGGGSIVAGSYVNTQAQDNSFVQITPAVGNMDYRLQFNANTLHNPTQYVITVWAKRGAAGGNPVLVTVRDDLLIGFQLLTPNINILGTTNTKYTGTLTFGNYGSPAVDGTIELDFSGNGLTSDLYIDFVEVDFYRQGEFLGQEIYICHNGKPTFGGVIESQEFSFSEQGYLVDLSGTDFGWPLPKRLFTQDYAQPVYLDQIVRDILTNTGSGLTYAGQQNIGGTMQQSFENENSLQFLVKVSNFAQYDFRIDFSKVLAFIPRGATGIQSLANTPADGVNIKMAKTPHSITEMRNRLIVYYNTPTLQPGDGDLWTSGSGIGNWVSQVTGLTAGVSSTNPPGTKVGADYVTLSWSNPPGTTFMQAYIDLNLAGVAPLNLRQWEQLKLWFAHSVNGTSYIAFAISLLKSSNGSGWTRTFDTSAFPVNTWVALDTLGPINIPTLADARGWSQTSPAPTDNNIDRIKLSWFIQTGVGTIMFDGLYFNRSYSILQLDDLGSENTYGLRGAMTYDKTRTDLNSATLLGKGQLTIKRYPHRKMELTLIGDETLLPAENLYVNSATLNIGQQSGWIQEYYSLRDITHHWSKDGFLSDVKVTDSLIAGLDLENVDQMLKDEILFSNIAAKGGTGGIIR